MHVAFFTMTIIHVQWWHTLLYYHCEAAEIHVHTSLAKMVSKATAAAAAVKAAKATGTIPVTWSSSNSWRNI